MLNEKFILIALFTGLIGISSYLRGMWRGEVVPNRVSWFLWSAVPMIAFTAEWRQGVGFPALTTLLAGFMPFIVFVASFFIRRSDAVWRLGTFDIACGTCAILAIVLWQLSGNANVGLAFSVIADAFASAPTVRKAWKRPETESAIPFALSNVRHVLRILTVSSYSFASLAFVLYDVFLNNLLVVLIIRKSSKSPQSPASGLQHL